MYFKSKGIIIYHSRWVIVECPKDVLDYYWHWIYKTTNKKLNKPRFGSHISVIRVTEECNRQNILYRKHHNEMIEFSYSNELQTNGDYWWLPVQCDKLELLREELGLSKEPEFGFHLTIGKEK